MEVPKIALTLTITFVVSWFVLAPIFYEVTTMKCKYLLNNQDILKVTADGTKDLMNCAIWMENRDLAWYGIVLLVWITVIAFILFIAMVETI